MAAKLKRDFGDEAPAKPTRASQLGGRAQSTSVQASKKSFLKDDFISKLPAEDTGAAEGSGASDADTQAVLQTLKDIEEMEAYLLGISKPSSGPRKTSVKGAGKHDSLEGAGKPPTHEKEPPQTPLHTATPVQRRRRQELTLEEDGDDLLNALGLGSGLKGDGQQGKKAGEEELRPARSKLDELLGRGSMAKVLEQSVMGNRKEFQLEKEEGCKEEDFVFGAYQPSVASTVKHRPARRPSVRQTATSTGALQQAAASQEKVATADGSRQPIPWLSTPKPAPAHPSEAANKVPSRDTSALVPTALILGEQETPSSQVATPRAHLQAVPQQQVRTLELEQAQHRLLLESLQQWHREDLELFESAHRSWVKVMEETCRQREERLRQEKEQLMAQLLSQSQDAEQAQAELVAQHQQCLATLEQQRTLELEQQRTLELEQLRELQRSLNGVIEQFSSDLHNLLHKVEARHHSTGHCDQQLKVLQDWMSQQQRDMEERLSQKAQEVIARMETRLGEHTRLLEQKRWRATAEQSEVESLQHLLKEQGQIMTQQLSIERAELERAKSALLEKEKSVMQKCSEERQKLAAEWAEVRTQQQLSKEWMKHEVERTLQMHSQREGTILSLAKEQADLKIRSRELKAKEEQLARDRELLDEAWRELRLEKEKVNRSALRIQQQEEKIKSMTNLSSQKYDEGERALREACRMESEQQSRLQVTQQHQHLHEANTPSPAHLGLGPPCQGPEPLPTASLSPFSWGWGMAYQRQQLQNLCDDLPSNSAMLLTTEQDLSAPVRGLSTLSAAAPHSWEAVPRLPPPLRTLPQHSMGRSRETYINLELLKFQAQQDHLFLENEQFFLESLKKAPYHTAPHSG
ncbi:fas-binding factor 1 homolog isoform X3 [Cuculus canorus]|uniref:fas-binding factor 1 homolog isoform X3 n=1 Tax=Cuculus canorus TaxID=55661 RepID=UPI0023AB1E39|nr:fas-binding factor 1 homolog isoform X3 [Cuculus canorus]